MVVVVEVVAVAVVLASKVESSDLGSHRPEQTGYYSYTTSVELEASVVVAVVAITTSAAAAVASVAAASILAVVSLAPSTSVDAYTLPVVVAAAAAASFVVA